MTQIEWASYPPRSLSGFANHQIKPAARNFSLTLKLANQIENLRQFVTIEGRERQIRRDGLWTFLSAFYGRSQTEFSPALACTTTTLSSLSNIDPGSLSLGYISQCDLVKKEMTICIYNACSDRHCCQKNFVNGRT
jgi:hypothetical protein